MTAYAVARFCVEFIRRDERGGLLGLTTSQLVAIGMIAACAYLSTVFKKRAAQILAAGPKANPKVDPKVDPRG
jgi:phosphatidylglycerol:prolipoprotein diacylglycerol transferase